MFRKLRMAGRYKKAAEVILKYNYLIREDYVNNGVSDDLTKKNVCSIFVLGAQLAIIDYLMKMKDSDAVAIKKIVMKELIVKDAPAELKRKMEELTGVFYKNAIDMINFYKPSGMNPVRVAAIAMRETIDMGTEVFELPILMFKDEQANLYVASDITDMLKKLAAIIPA